ncbi:uncharacterized protein RJT20DRAFT_131567 [Scheffersomyces xylosifermentans]|uniref:uncharacterized protein n=1 Tax=Scheffersomyces xylosifermentans TaxID=1304137 RepID=UPI00315DD6F3
MVVVWYHTAIGKSWVLVTFKQALSSLITNSIIWPLSRNTNESGQISCCKISIAAAAVAVNLILMKLVLN